VPHKVKSIKPIVATYGLVRVYAYGGRPSRCGRQDDSTEWV